MSNPRDRFFQAAKIIAIGPVGTFLFDSVVSKNRKLIYPGPLFIIDVGSLIKLNHQATIGAFQKIAEKQGKEFKLTPEKFAAIFAADDKHNSGALSEGAFRETINQILNIHPTVEEFDEAWNLMLGDTNVLAMSLQQLKELNVNLVFVSNTNPIHARKLNLESMNPIYLSYQTKCLGLDNLKNLVKEGVDPKHSILTQRNFPHDANPINQRNVQRANQVESWASSVGFEILHFDNNVIDAIRLYQAEHTATMHP